MLLPSTATTPTALKVALVITTRVTEVPRGVPLGRLRGMIAGRKLTRGVEGSRGWEPEGTTSSTRGVWPEGWDVSLMLIGALKVTVARSETVVPTITLELGGPGEARLITTMVDVAGGKVTQKVNGNVATLPAASWAEQLTVVFPGKKAVPGAGTQVTAATTPSTTSVAVGVKLGVKVVLVMKGPRVLPATTAVPSKVTLISGGVMSARTASRGEGRCQEHMWVVFDVCNITG